MQSLICRLVCVLLFAFVTTAAYALEFTVDDAVYSVNAGGQSVTLKTLSTSYEGVFDIPASVVNGGKTYTVTAIGSYAFYQCTSLTRASVPETVVEMGPSSFQDCSNLRTVVLNCHISEIPRWTFYNCSSLLNVNIPSSVKAIGDVAFMKCSSLTSITLPDSLVSIGKNSFNEAGLRSIVIPDLVTTVGSSFPYCKSLTEVTVGESVKTISEYAFHNVPKISKLVVKAKRCTSIGLSASTIELGDKVEYIPASLFRYYTASTVELPASVVEIGTSAFYGSKILSLVLPPNLTTIGNSAFKNCSNLVDLTIPNSVIYVGENVFEGCPWIDNQPDGVVYVGSVAYKYKGTMPANTNMVIKDGTVTIAANLFYGYNSRLKSVTFPNSLVNIESQAFYSCLALKSLHIPSSVENISYDAFKKCSNITSVTVDSDNLRYASPEGCNALIDMKNNWLIFGTANTIIPETVKIISSYAFFCCTNLKTIKIPESVTEISTYAFQRSGLTKVDIPKSIYKIYGEAFSGCESLTELTLNGAPQIVSKAFVNCPNLSVINCHSENPPTLTNTDVFKDVDKTTCVLNVPLGCSENYMVTAGWRYFYNIVEVDFDKSQPGDLNGDKSINVSDVSQLYKALLSGETEQVYDINGDGEVNTGDVSALYKLILTQ